MSAELNSEAKKNIRLIGIIGKIGAGKTKFVELAKQIYGEANVIELTFADPIKKIALMMGFRADDVYGTQEQKEIINPTYGISGRYFMQNFGTYMRDNMGRIVPGIRVQDNIWVKILEAQLSEVEKNLELKNTNEKKLIIVSDCRFLNEANLINRLGGNLIYIKRPDGAPNSVGAPSAISLTVTHVSEDMASNPGTNYPDIRIVNDGDLDAYKKKIKYVCDYIFDGKMPSFKLLDIMEI